MPSLPLPVNDGDWRDDWLDIIVFELFIVFPRQHAGEETAGKHEGGEENWRALSLLENVSMSKEN